MSKKAFNFLSSIIMVCALVFSLANMISFDTFVIVGMIYAIGHTISKK